MRKSVPLILVSAILLLSGVKSADAEALQLKPTYDLGDNYSLHLGRKAGGLFHTRNIVGLKKNDFMTEGDAMTFTLNRPYQDFGGDGASLGFVYSTPVQEKITTTLSLTSGPADGGLQSKQDVAVGFYIHIKLQ